MKLGLAPLLLVSACSSSPVAPLPPCYGIRDSADYRCDPDWGGIHSTLDAPTCVCPEYTACHEVGTWTFCALNAGQ